jgi:hypothetical protein
MALYLAILTLLVALGGSVHPTPMQQAVSAEGTDTHMTQGSWSGGFVDSEDLEAMKDWAHGMCRGVEIDRTAKRLKVEPTIEAVATALIGNVSDNPKIRKAAQQVCERELRRANKPS